MEEVVDAPGGEHCENVKPNDDVADYVEILFLPYYCGSVVEVCHVFPGHEHDFENEKLIE